MIFYDEDAAVKAIKSLPLPVRMHLSHIVRNGMANVLSALKCGCVAQDCGAEKALMEMETRWKDLGL